MRRPQSLHSPISIYGFVMVQDGSDLIHIDMRKWPDRRHWQLEASRLGVDEYGTWIHIPSGTIAQRGHEPPRSIGVGFVALVPLEAWWIVEFYVHHPRHSVYVNIGTPPVWNVDALMMIDLDLDVVRTLDGTVELLDEDDFVAHQVQHSYPTALVDRARAAADAAAFSLDGRVEPFGCVAELWIGAVSPSSLS